MSLQQTQEKEQLHTPILVFDKRVIQQNLQEMVRVAEDPTRIWSHVKTHKCAEVLKLLLSCGMKQFKCATFAEAEMTAIAGAEKLILAYPLVGPSCMRMVQLIKAYPNTHCYALADDLGQLTHLSTIAIKEGICVSVLLDVDVGNHRTGIALEQVLPFLQEAISLTGIELCGLHCYDGHLSMPSAAQRIEEVAKIYRDIDEIVTKSPCALPLLVMGGTPTFPYHAERINAALSPGTTVLYDFGYQSKFDDLAFTPAAAIWTRVVSHPGKGLFTLDLGYKGISADPAGVRGTIVELPQAVSQIHSEEHWVFSVAEEQVPAIGTMLTVIPTHICPTVALYPSAVIVNDGEVIDEWMITARNRRLTI